MAIIKIPDDGFCGTHALFLQTLLLIYTHRPTLHALTEKLAHLNALEESARNGSLTKASLQELFSEFPPLHKAIEEAEDPGAAFRIVSGRCQLACQELNDLDSNPNFSRLKSNLIQCLPDATEASLLNTIQTLAWAFIETSRNGSFPDKDTRNILNYNLLLRAFMETVVSSDVFQRSYAENQEYLCNVLRPEMNNLRFQAYLFEKLYDKFQAIATANKLPIDPQDIKDSVHSYLLHTYYNPPYTSPAPGDLGAFDVAVRTFYDREFEVFSLQCQQDYFNSGIDESPQKLESLARDTAQAIAQHSSATPDEEVNLLLRSMAPQTMFATQQRASDRLYSAIPNMGNLLRSFEESGYTETTCSSEIWTEDTDLNIVQQMIKAETALNQVLQVTLDIPLVGGNHFNLSLPDQGFLLETLDHISAPSHTASAEELPASQEQPLISDRLVIPGPPSPVKQPPSYDKNTVASENDNSLIETEKQLLRKSDKKVQQMLREPPSSKHHRKTSHLASALAKSSLGSSAPITEKHAEKFSRNIDRISEKIGKALRVTESSDHARSRLLTLKNELESYNSTPPTTERQYDDDWSKIVALDNQVKAVKESFYRKKSSRP